MRTSDTLVVALWAAVAAGLPEGAILSVANAFPAILASKKASVEILWVAPLEYAVLFALGALPVLFVASRVAKIAGQEPRTIVYASFVFLVTLAWVATLAVIHIASAILLAAGVTVFGCRLLEKRWTPITDLLRHRVWLIPIVLSAMVAGTSGYHALREARSARQLPPLAGGSPHVLVIMLDTVRADVVSGGLGLTPNLDRLAAEGIRYQNAWAPSSWSLPSQASILTGRYPRDHGADWPDFRMQAVPTLASYFAGRGYATGAFSGNAAWITREYVGRGFLRFDDYLVSDLLRRTLYGRIVDRALWEVGYHAAGRGKRAPHLNAQYLEFRRDYPSRPTFAYLCYMDVNQALHRRKLGAFGRIAPAHEVWEAYRAGLQALDRHIGDLIGGLQRSGRYDNTIVVVASDHGESMGPAHYGDHDPSGHGTSLYAEQVRVPLIVRYPPQLPRGQTVASAVNVRAIAATLANLTGADGEPFPGPPLPMADEQGDESPSLSTLLYGDRNLQSVAWERWQYIVDGSTREEAEEVFDLAADPLAQHNLASQPPVISHARTLLRDLIRPVAYGNRGSR